MEALKSLQKCFAAGSGVYSSAELLLAFPTLEELSTQTFQIQ